ncbi:MAG TPA: pyrroloquinoline quinone biosynthesis peptide chaperone PqqD [Pseudomonadales bacterium]|nr:pyrroloquinoline quinone biosynthesis peptide chaperone PqqD [Pseudomonadales bacterium]
MSAITAEQTLRLSAMYRLQWEEAQQCFVLLYPEGMVQLNGPAGEILSLIDGSRSNADIIATLANKFPEAEGLAEDVLAFLDDAQQHHWVSVRQ